MLLMGALTIAVGQRTVTGTISDSDGIPIIGANVLVAGSTVGTATDLDGNFSIDVPANINALVISYVGFTEKIVDITGLSNVTITLSEGQLLDEVVVTAAGVSRNARETVYANQTVSSEDLLSVTNKNTLEALRGKTAGVRLTTGSGSVGASTRIVLRGEGSLTGDNNALIVVDGIPIDNTSSSGGDGTSTGGYADHGNRFNDINPDDIESVTILKGPSATSLYGSRGASGVVLIKTKKGLKGTKMRIDLNTSYSAEEAYVLLQRQDKFGQGYDNAHLDSGENWSWGPAFDGVVRPWTSPIDSDGDGAVEALTRPYSNVPNQLQEFFNRGNTASNSVAFSGGTDGFTYRASYSNVNQNGILENTYYKRNTISVAASAQLSEKLKSDFSVSYASTNQNTAQEGSRAFEGNNAYAMAVQSPVNIPFGELRDYKSPFHGIDGYWGSYSSVNPYFILNEYGNEGKINNVLGNASLTYNLIPGLDIVGRFGANVVSTNIETWTPAFTPALQQIWGDDLVLSSRGTKHSSVGDYTSTFVQNANLDFTAQAVYNKEINQDFSIDVTAGYNWFQRETKSLTGATSGGLVVPGWYNLNNSTAAARSSQFNSLYRIYGLLGNARLNYKNYAFLEYSARNDWSSTLPAANNTFFYNAFGASLVVTDMLKVDSDILNFAKLRASYGTSGKDAGLYLLQSTYVGNPTVAALGDFAIFFPLNGQPGFTTGNRIGNPDLKPELTTTFEIGGDVGLLNERINVAYTYYSSDHSNQIVQISLPRSTGFTTTVANIGRMTNKGHELTVTLKPIVGLVKGLHWELFGTYAKNTNRVEKITDDISELVVGGPFTPGVSIVAKEGFPFGTYKALAESRSPDGKVIVDGVTGYPVLTNEEQYLGSYIPDYTASFGTNINYKGVGFSMLLDIKKGGSFVSQTKSFVEFNGTGAHTAIYNREEYIYPNSVIDNGDGTFRENDIPITEQAFFTENDPANSLYVIDASYIKLREMAVSYEFPKKLLSKASISGATLSVFARNVKFWLPEENSFADPEINGPALTGNASGIETTQTPPARSIGVNLKFSF